MSVVKKKQSIKKLRERVKLLHRSWKELEDGSFTEKIEELGEAWCQLEYLDNYDVGGLLKWNNTKEKAPKAVYKVVMRKCFSCYARHAYVNALRLNYRFLYLLKPLHVDEDGIWVNGIAGDFGREDHYG